MARIRSIKPEFWTDEKVVELSPFARLLFIGMWNFVDDEGRMVYSPKRIKMQVFPADSIDLTGLLEEIRKSKLVYVYTVDGVEYLQVCGFLKHQKIDKRSKSKLPAPPNSAECMTECGINSTNDPHEIDVDSTSPAESPRIPPNSPESRRIPPTDQGRDQGRDQGGDQGKTTSVPIGTEASPRQAEKIFDTPEGLSHQDALFRIAVPWLVSRGVKDSNARSLLGGAAKQLGSDGAWLLAAECMDVQPVDAVAWIAGAIKSRMKPPKTAPYESPRDKSRRETYEGLTGRRSNEPLTIDL